VVSVAGTWYWNRKYSDIVIPILSYYNIFILTICLILMEVKVYKFKMKYMDDIEVR